MKTSIRRLNQLGYFKPLEGNEKDMKVDKTPGQTNMVDVTLKLEEQNRNQLTFGAGVSQYEGFFGQLAFQTSNFMGRGESLTVSLQGGERAQNFQVGFTEPFLFDRNITGGVDVHKRSLQYIGYYTQKSTGGNVTFGVPVGIFSRMFFNYSYETISITDLNEALIDNSCLLTGSCSTISNLGDLASTLTDAQLVQVQRNPFVADALLLPQGGKRTISKVVPTFLHNTVDHPIFPTQGKKYTAAIDLAVLGGNTQFLKPRLEGIWFFKHTSRTQLGLRGQFEYIAPVRKTTELLLPTFERLFLGGEYSVRGFDIRSIGPTVAGIAGRARRQQEPSLQRRIQLHDRTARATAGLLRCRPGPRFWRIVWVDTRMSLGSSSRRRRRSSDRSGISFSRWMRRQRRPRSSAGQARSRRRPGSSFASSCRC